MQIEVNFLHDRSPFNCILLGHTGSGCSLLFTLMGLAGGLVTGSRGERGGWLAGWMDGWPAGRPVVNLISDQAPRSSGKSDGQPLARRRAIMKRAAERTGSDRFGKNIAFFTLNRT